MADRKVLALTPEQIQSVHDHGYCMVEPGTDGAREVPVDKGGHVLNLWNTGYTLRHALCAMALRAEKAERELAEATERIRHLEIHGPDMVRGERGDGTEEYGTMRQVMEDYAQAARAEVRAGDAARTDLAEAKRDAKRFVWVVMDGAFDGLVLDHSGVRDLSALDSLDYAKLVREAIDAAMQETPK